MIMQRRREAQRSAKKAGMKRKPRRGSLEYGETR